MGSCGKMEQQNRLKNWIKGGNHQFKKEKAQLEHIWEIILTYIGG